MILNGCRALSPSATWRKDQRTHPSQVSHLIPGAGRFVLESRVRVSEAVTTLSKRHPKQCW
jgi:hypothetical protein